MPYKHTRYKIPRELNKNVKLSLNDREEIRKAYATGNTSQRKLAKAFGVSRRLIMFILNPEAEKRAKEIRNSKNYYDKDKHKHYMRKHRENKQKLYLKGELIK